MYAKENFHLLEARTGDVRVEMPWRRDRPFMNPHVVFSEAPVSAPLGSPEHITAVIGKNGTGKSHLLSAIVQTFIALEDLQKGKKTTIRDLPLEYLFYRIDGSHCSVRRLSRRELELRVDNDVVSINDLPLPSRVVALTITPFDKFPVPRPARYSDAPEQPSIYHYLGLRDRFHKASMENLLYRSLSNLFEEGENEVLRRINIGRVFEYLGLQPTLSVIYRLRIHSDLRKALAEEDEDKIVIAILSGENSQTRRLYNSNMDVDQLQYLVRQAQEHAEKGVIRITADFKLGGYLDETFKELQPLRKAGLLRLSGVEVTQDNGLVSDLKRASSGQLSMISSLLALASVITDASLVLIDEPELSLHPEWQVDYVDLLVKTFSRFSGCHFIIATHSPMVISELPEHANVIALDRDDLPPVNELSGQSADYLLAEVFGTPMNGNLYVRKRIVDALRLVANGGAHSPEFAAALVELRKFAEELERDDPAGQLIGNLEEIARQAGTEVQS